MTRLDWLSWHGRLALVADQLAESQFPSQDGRPSGHDAASLLVLDVAGRGSSMIRLTDAMRVP